MEQAKESAYAYIDGLEGSRVFPDDAAVAALEAFGGPMPEEPSEPSAILDALHRVGSKAAVSQSGGRYFGFVNGSNFPVGLAARWLADAWDQNSALYVMSPIVSKLEETCERWIAELLGLPEGTAAGFVSGSSTATLCALAAARNELLLRKKWDVHQDGLFGAPPVRVVLGVAGAFVGVQGAVAPGHRKEPAHLGARGRSGAHFAGTASPAGRGHAADRAGRET